MEYALLRSLRALGPGLILVGYVDLFFIFVLKEAAIFWPLDTARLILIGYVLGGIYGAIASALSRDVYAFEGVQDALMSALATVDASVSVRSWKGDVAPCFYHLVDNDKSLGQKSKGIYFNGFIVTTSFDAIWISLLAGVVGCFAVFYTSSWWFVVISAAILLSCYAIWRLSIARHHRLGKEQVLVIKKRFATRFSDCLSERQEKVSSS